MSDVPTLQFHADREGLTVDLPKLVASRMLIQANSGGGKSWAIRYLLEQTHGQVQQLVLDSEGEFASLREQFPYVLAGKGGDLPATTQSAKLLARRLVELGASAVIDIYDLSLADRKRFVRLFLEELMHLPRSLWRPLLVVIDEAHRYVPETGSSEAADAVTTLCTQGRKRGFCAVLATQRLSKLSKDAAAELLNKLIGRTHLDVDVRRAGDDLGFSKEERQKLKRLRPGEFYVYGPAIGREVTLVQTGDVETTHPEPGKIAPAPPPPPDEVRKLIDQLEDLEAEAEEEERTIEALEAKVKELSSELRKTRKELEVAAFECHDDCWSGEDLEREIDIARREAKEEAWQEAIDATQMAVIGVLDDVGDRIISAIGSDDDCPPLSPRATPNGTRPVTSKRSTAQVRSGGLQIVEETQSPVSTSGSAVENGDELPGAQRRILDALATLESIGVERVSRQNLAVFSRQSPKSSAYQAHVAKLEQAGLVTYPGAGEVSITLAGRDMAVASFDIRSAADLHEAWFSYLNDAQTRILRALLEAYPADVDRDELAGLAGQSNRSSAYQAHVATLQQLGAAEYPEPGRVRASELLFPARLR